jgi:hypothetical protein
MLKWTITLTLLFFFAVSIGFIAYAALGGVIGGGLILIALGSLQYPLLRYVGQRIGPHGHDSVQNRLSSEV